MIDLTHNRHTGFALIHDDETLRKARRVLIGRDGDIRLIEASGRLRRLSRKVPTDLIAQIRTFAAMPLIQVRGTHAVAVDTISIFAAL
jgi:hypothetical protein